MTTYQDAGVNIENGNTLVSNIKRMVELTHSSNVLDGIGGFCAAYELPLTQYKSPVLVSSTDGVGTKLDFGIKFNENTTIGIDLVGMCVNDIITSGATPLFFLDYFATGHLDISAATDIIRGITLGCHIAGCSLVGGETAEMPGFYPKGKYDLGGFCVGIVERDQMITTDRVNVGDQLIAIGSSGFHSNGYSLIHKILESSSVNFNTRLNGRSIKEWLLMPTRIYVSTILTLLKSVYLHGVAHITGGGIIDNLPRILPNGTAAKLDFTSYIKPEIFNWIQQLGNISQNEMLKVFNCGIGMIICVANEDTTRTLDRLSDMNENAWVIGEIIKSQGEPSVILI